MAYHPVFKCYYTTEVKQAYRHLSFTRTRGFGLGSSTGMESNVTTEAGLGSSTGRESDVATAVMRAWGKKKTGENRS